MLIEEEPKIVGEVNPDALEAVFDDSDTVVEEEMIVFTRHHDDDEDANALDIPFTDDNDDW